ncbi:type II toxin-antitoxin system HicB family antitoxin [Rhodovibrionaceae bacterium A322]
MRRYYPALIHTQSDGSVQASFPDFPDLTCRAATLDSLHASAQESLGRKVVELFDANRALPLATAISDLPPPLEGQTAPVVTLVPIVTSSRKQKVNLMLEEGLLREIDLVATSRSAFIDEAIRFRLAADVGLAQQESGTRPAPQPTANAAPEPIAPIQSPVSPAAPEAPDTSPMVAPLPPTAESTPEPGSQPTPESGSQPIPEPAPQPDHQPVPAQTTPGQDLEQDPEMTPVEASDLETETALETSDAVTDDPEPATVIEDEPQPASLPS